MRPSSRPLQQPSTYRNPRESGGALVVAGGVTDPGYEKSIPQAVALWSPNNLETPNHGDQFDKHGQRRAEYEIPDVIVAAP